MKIATTTLARFSAAELHNAVSAAIGAQNHAASYGQPEAAAWFELLAGTLRRALLLRGEGLPAQAVGHTDVAASFVNVPETAVSHIVKALETLAWAAARPDAEHALYVELLADIDALGLRYQPA